MAADRLRKDPSEYIWVSLTSLCFRKVVEVVVKRVEEVGVGVTLVKFMLWSLSGSRVHDPPSRLNKRVFVLSLI